jgi:hypothetical protein
LTGVTQQEKQFAEQISRFAQRAAEGKGVQVGQRVVQVGGGGEGYSEPVMRSPGYVLLEQYGMNPNEEVVIPGGGFMFGGDKPMKAYEVMDLRLKEIAQPLIESKKTAKVAAKDSEEDPLIEAALEKARTGKLKKD